MKAHDIHQLYLNKQYSQVISELKTAQQHPSLKNYYIAIEAQCLYCIGRFDRAAELFKSLIPVVDNKYEAITNYLACLATITSKKHTLDQQLLDGEAYQEVALNYALCLLNNGDIDEARKVLNIAKTRANEASEELDPLYYALNYLLGGVSLKDASEHLSAIDTTILTLPEDTGAYITLPKHLQKNVILNKSISLLKNHVPAMNFLTILQDDEDFKRLIEDHDQLIEKTVSTETREGLKEKKNKPKTRYPVSADLSKANPDTSAKWKKKELRKKKKTPPSGHQGRASDKQVEVSAVKSHKTAPKKKGGKRR